MNSKFEIYAIMAFFIFSRSSVSNPYTLLKAEQRADFNRRLAEMLALKKLMEKKEPKDLLDIQDQNVTEKLEEQFCADWVKREMDEEAWRRLSAQERQKLIIQAKLAEKALRQEMYGDDWQKKLDEMRGNEAALDDLRAKQKALFAAKLKERMDAQISQNILVLIIGEKYKLISTISTDAKYEKIKEAEMEIVKSLPEEDPVIQFSALNNLLEISCCATPETLDNIDFMMKNLADMNSASFQSALENYSKNISVPSSEELLARVNALPATTPWKTVSDYIKINHDLLQTKFSAMAEGNKLWSDPKMNTVAEEYANYSTTWLNCRKFQIYLQMRNLKNTDLDDKKKEDKAKRLARQVIALSAALKIQNGSNLKIQDIYAKVMIHFFNFLHNGHIGAIKSIVGRPMNALLTALLAEYSHNELEEKLQNQIKEKYNSLRLKALKLISKGDPTNPRPKPEAKQFLETLKADVEKAQHDRKQLNKLMKKQGFSWEDPPEESFGANLGRLYFYCNEERAS